MHSLYRVFTAETRTPDNGHRAIRSVELNIAISQLWQAAGIHSQADFTANIVPLYTTVLQELQRYLSPEAAEQCLITLLEDTTKACRYRWTVRLPMKRPGSDYRKYEIIYTYALMTAMAVGCLAESSNTDAYEQLANHLLPKAGFTQLQGDSLVWADWLGYFQKAEQGGLYAVSLGTKPVKNSPKPTVMTPSPTTGRQHTVPPVGSGRAMLQAIRSALEEGSLSCNQPGDAVQVDREGRTFLEHPHILKWCIAALALPQDISRAKARFSRLKVHRRSASGHQFYYGRRDKHDRRRVGYVLENASALWSGNAPKGPFVIEQVTTSKREQP